MSKITRKSRQNPQFKPFYRTPTIIGRFTSNSHIKLHPKHQSNPVKSMVTIVLLVSFIEVTLSSINKNQSDHHINQSNKLIIHQLQYLYKIIHIIIIICINKNSPYVGTVCFSKILGRYIQVKHIIYLHSTITNSKR